jgi:hypothetical protein
MNWWKLANVFELSRQINDAGVPSRPAAELGHKLQDDEEFKEIMNMNSLMREEKEWTRAMQTAGSRVKHDTEGWEGIVWRPVRDPVNGSDLVGVEHPFTENKTTIMAKRFYRPTILSVI